MRANAAPCKHRESYRLPIRSRDIMQAQQAHAVAPLSQDRQEGSVEALADAALEVIRLCLVTDDFVPRGAVTFALMGFTSPTCRK